MSCQYGIANLSSDDPRIEQDCLSSVQGGRSSGWLTVYKDTKMIFQALKAGACGYFNKKINVMYFSMGMVETSLPLATSTS